MFHSCAMYVFSAYLDHSELLQVLLGLVKVFVALVLLVLRLQPVAEGLVLYL